MLSLVRHGRTAANAAGLLLGRSDVGLDDLGRWQAARLATALGPVDRVITSPLARTRQTAEFLGVPPEIDERFIEIDFGVLEGVALREVDPSTWDKLRNDVQFAPERGESFASVAERVGAAMSELLPSAGELHVVVVSHVLPIKAAVAWALDAGIEMAWRLHLDQASITRIDAGDAGPLMRTYNEIAHLGDGPS